MQMFPTLFTIGNFGVSSFGIFLALGFLLGVILVWRLARAWDLDEEKVLDLTILTFFGGVIFSRIYFVWEHLSLFLSSPLKIFLFTKTPGFSLWGAFLGGWLTLYFFSRKFKINFWQAADIAAVGFLGGLVLKNLGCLLGGCDIGITSKFFLAVPMIGVVGKRIPAPGLEALLLTLILLKIWYAATHFHQRGKIVSSVLIFWGLVRFLLEPLKQQKELFFDAILFILGLTIFYKITGRNVLVDLRMFLKFVISIFISAKSRKRALQTLTKSWYNQKTALFWKLKDIKKAAGRINVKFSYKNP